MTIGLSNTFISTINQVASGIVPAPAYEDFAWWSNQTETNGGTGDTHFLVGSNQMVTTNPVGSGNSSQVITTKAALAVNDAGSIVWTLTGVSLGNSANPIIEFGLSSSNTALTGTSRIRLYIQGNGSCTLQVGTTSYGTTADTTTFNNTTIQNLTSITITWNGTNTCTASITDGTSTAALSIATNYPTSTVKLFFGHGGTATAEGAASVTVTDIAVTP